MSIVPAFALLRIWGLPSATQQALLHALTEGFRIGSVTIEPTRIVLALMALALLLSFGSWARSALDQRLLRTRLDRGAPLPTPMSGSCRSATAP